MHANVAGQVKFDDVVQPLVHDDLHAVRQLLGESQVNPDRSIFNQRESPSIAQEVIRHVESVKVGRRDPLVERDGESRPHLKLLDQIRHVREMSGEIQTRIE